MLPNEASTDSQQRDYVATDYDLHGIVGIRAIDASPQDIRAIDNQLGPIKKQLQRDPDIVLRFVDRLPEPRVPDPRVPEPRVPEPRVPEFNGAEGLRLLGAREAGFSADHFMVLKGRFKSRTRVQVPFDQIGTRCEIVCEHGLAQVPLLISIINLTALQKGSLPLHAAAFSHDNCGYLVTGWSKGGKTETLLSFMQHDAHYIGDEWIYLSADGQSLHGIPEPIRVWNWHLQSMPHLRRRLDTTTRLRMRVLQTVENGLKWLTADGRRHRNPFSRTLNRLRPYVAGQLGTDVTPARLFGSDSCTLHGNFDKILLVSSHEESTIKVKRIDAEEVAQRMVFSLQDEQSRLQSFYWKYRFAFPERSNPVIEQSQQLQADALRRILRGKDAFDVRHPHPFSIPEIFDAIREECR